MTTSEDRLAELRTRFAHHGRAERTRLKRAAEDGDRKALQEVAHGLAGQAGLFGFPEISQAALALERALSSGFEGDSLQEQIDALMSHLDSLRPADPCS